LNGDQKTGVSLMYVAKELDAGNVIKQFEIPINEDETYISLYDKLSNLSYKVIKENIHDLFNQNVKSISQDNSKVTYARVISREDERIN
jgi:methionyl-tRNA formyltransferase